MIAWLALPKGRKSASGSVAEAAFTAFCFAGRPVTLVCIFGLAWAAAVYVDARIFVATHHVGYLHRGQLHRTGAFGQILKAYGTQITFTLPAVIAAIRGRRYLRSIIFGRLSPLSMTLIGIATAIGVRALSVVLDSGRYTLPMFVPAHVLVGVSGASALDADVIYPFAEEMFYQVGLQTTLQRFGPIVAVIGTTALFFGVHCYGGYISSLDLFTKVLPSLTAFAIVRQTTKSFGAAFVAHAFYNTLTSTLFEWSR